MNQTDELKQQVKAKRAEVARLHQAKQLDAAAEAADELTSLVNEFKIAQAKEESDFKSFLAHARPLEATAPYLSGHVAKYNGGVVGDEYHQSFLNAIRHKFKDSSTGALYEGTPAMGGYLVPAEFAREILSRLEDENILRTIGTTIQTASEHRIPVVATPPAASWFAERQLITPTDETFDQLTLGAYKLAATISVSNELLADSFYDLGEHLTTEFSKAMARAEEDAFLTGDGNGKPAGILPTLAADSDSYVTGTFTTETYVDDIVRLQYSVPRAYRRNASWLISEELIQSLRKAKDTTGRFMWQDSLSEGEPPMLLGNPVYTSPFFPKATTGNIPMLYGDFSFFKIAERGTRTMKALSEVRALEDMTVFMMIERVDGLLVDKNAVKGLKIA